MRHLERRGSEGLLEEAEKLLWQQGGAACLELPYFFLTFDSVF